jgi:uroporphyrinogen-III decarboxylase
MRRIFAEAKNRGSFSCLHLCGKISDLSSSLASLELDLLSFEEWHAPMWCAMPKTIPMGYVSTESFLWGNKEKLCEEVNRCLKEMPRPCILSSGCDIPAKADPELVKTMLKARNVTIV